MIPHDGQVCKKSIERRSSLGNTTSLCDSDEPAAVANCHTRRAQTQWKVYQTSQDELQRNRQRENGNISTQRPVHECTLTGATLQQKQLKCPSVGEWINEMGDVHRTKHYSALQRDKALIYTTKCMDLENSLSESSQTQEATCHRTPSA